MAADGRIEPGDMLLQVCQLPWVGGEREVPEVWRKPSTPAPRPPPEHSCFLTPSPLSQVNEINFENMSNDDAVRVLREIVHKPGYEQNGVLGKMGKGMSGKRLGLAFIHPAFTRTTLFSGPSL